MNVTVESLDRKFKGEGEKRFLEIAELGGWVATNRPSITARELDHADGLDLSGALDPDNKEISESKKDRIRELAGIADENKTVKKEK